MCLVIHYHQLNTLVVDERFPLPVIEDIIKDEGVMCSKIAWASTDMNDSRDSNSGWDQVLITPSTPTKHPERTACVMLNLFPH